MQLLIPRPPPHNLCIQNALVGFNEPLPFDLVDDPLVEGRVVVGLARVQLVSVAVLVDLQTLSIHLLFYVDGSLRTHLLHILHILWPLAHHGHKSLIKHNAAALPLIPVLELFTDLDHVVVVATVKLRCVRMKRLQRDGLRNSDLHLPEDDPAEPLPLLRSIHAHVFLEERLLFLLSLASLALGCVAKCVQELIHVLDGLLPLPVQRATSRSLGEDVEANV
mmetsp:Transcript_34016/g.87212  ORF Transcript_34016/g.87212 Transcript_34016/m.87212 type:complete len:221 (-) Transcript_34016:375-1037(-)